jgi:hypothetical protein
LFRLRVVAGEECRCVDLLLFHLDGARVAVAAEYLLKLFVARADQARRDFGEFPSTTPSSRLM